MSPYLNKSKKHEFLQKRKLKSKARYLRVHINNKANEKDTVAQDDVLTAFLFNDSVGSLTISNAIKFFEKLA